MEIIEVENTKQIPSITRGFTLNDSYTPDSAAHDYQRHYQAEPKRAWKWGSYLYIELPEGVTK